MERLTFASTASTGRAARAWVPVACLALTIAACSGKSEKDDHPGGKADAGFGGSPSSAGKGGASGRTGSSGKTGSSGTGNRAGAGASAGRGSGGMTSGSGGQAGTGDTGATGQGHAGSAGSAGGGFGGEGAGGSAAGGRATGGAGASDGGGEGGAAANCSGAAFTAMGHGTRARSSGFSGTLDQYDTLYDTACTTQADCATQCLAVGGTTEMCAGDYCMMEDTNYCLPATIWTGLSAVYTEGTDILSDSAQLVVWPDPYRDYLLVDDFNLSVPADADITGITATIRRAGGGPDEAADGGVFLIKGGVMGTVDKSTSMAWSGDMLESIDYGGASDTWGQTWTPADVNADDFGVAVSARYPEAAGNGRAYVDIVSVTVTYRRCAP